MKKLFTLVAAMLLGGFAMAQSAVVYFSATGTTRAAAEKIAKVTGSDLIEIKPAVPYTQADLNWRDGKSRTSEEKNDRETNRPKIANKIDVAKYDVIYVGFPIWWDEAPNIIYNFVETTNLEGKTVCTFFTSGGSGIGRTLKVFEKKAPKAIWKSAKNFNGNVSDNEIKNWK